MRIGPVLIITAISAATAACSEANAAELSPSNPLHCAMQFESYSILAKRMGKNNEAKGYGTRAHWYINRARSLPAEQLAPVALKELEQRILAAPDGGLALATECFKRQDADPEFQKILTKAEAAIRSSSGS